ncbi:ArsR/SmtB family transcription factor [Streptomyces nigrescens]|nr:helix-turn-helix domain-containing protein [Streptomyces nigrescens]
MTVRIHFTVEDLARTHVAERPDPLWEALLSQFLLRSNSPVPGFARWRRQTLSQLNRPARALLALAPPHGYSPDFLTPAASALGLEEGLQSLATTPRDRFEADLGRFTRLYHAPLWIRELTPRQLPRIADAVRDYYTAAIRPYESQIRTHLEVDRRLRTIAVQSGGTRGLLDGLHPNVRWKHPVLEVRSHYVDREVHLGGRGLRLIPSFFCSHGPMMLRDPQLPPVLLYPVQRSLTWQGAGTGKDNDVRDDAKGACAALLGTTRAAALEAIAAGGCTTTKLARRLKISAATATHHTAILRDAGLISSQRTGGSVHHTLRPLGEALLQNR